MTINSASPIGSASRRSAIDTDAMLRCAAGMQASDIHLKSSMAPMIRLNGELAAMPGFAPLSALEVRDTIASFLDDKRRKEWELNLELDTAVDVADIGRFRLNAYFDRLGPAAALRLIPPQIPSFDDICLDEKLKDKLLPTSGLVLVTGATGVGKSTTLAVLLDTVLRNRAAHVLTLEAPIEFILHPHRGMVSQREVGRHTNSFDIACISSLRQDPDVIMIGELRDAVSIEMALTIAETGHLVLASLHSPDATGTLERILGAIPAERQPQARTQLASCLKAVISQKLISRVDRGGRVAAREILLSAPALSALIRDNKLHQVYSTIEMNGELGMCTMEYSLSRLVEAGLISYDDAIVNAYRPDNLRIFADESVKGRKKRGR
ncbi:MAG: type IV pilus twitching motility protein PilT [Candidatus Bruticola sp.]